jgi:L-ascorbate metabolism protein UlaG (beta-lactamase superfamily)
VIDPWLANDPFWRLAQRTEDRIGEIDVIPVTHTHFDHASGADEIVRQNKKVAVMAQYEHAYCPYSAE